MFLKARTAVDMGHQGAARSERTKLRTMAVLVLVCAGSVPVTSLSARANDPKVPAGIDPGLEPVAILTTGLDYTDPQIAARLARDGEGELIAWDFVDNDRLPFAKSPNETAYHWGGDGSALVRGWLASPDAVARSLIPVRIDPADPGSLAQALTFVAQTRAKIVAVPMWSSNSEDWQPFAAAAKRFSDLVVIVPGCNSVLQGVSTYPAGLDLPNLRRVAPGAVAPSGLDAAVLEACRYPGLSPKGAK